MIIEKLEQVYEELVKPDVTCQTKYSFVHKTKTNNKNKNMSLGKIWFNLILPDDYELIDTVVDKPKMEKIMCSLTKRYEPSKASEYISLINQEVFKMGTYNPISFSEDSFIVPDFIIKEKEAFLKTEFTYPDFSKKQVELGKKFLDYLKEISPGIYDIIMSGSKGSPMDWAVLTIMKGSTVDIEGNVSEPITNSQNDGFNLKGFYNMAGEARSMQFTKSVSAQDPGSLARDIVFAISNIKFDKKDCKTKLYLSLTITDSLSKVINGRYYVDKDDKLQFIEDGSMLVGTTIQLRSPIYCKSKIGICNICCGDLPNQGGFTNIGINAADELNSIGINAAMKARHKTTQVTTKNPNFKKDLIRIN
jgi:hypothetical protein